MSDEECKTITIYASIPKYLSDSDIDKILLKNIGAVVRCDVLETNSWNEATKSIFVDILEKDLKIELPAIVTIHDYEIKFFNKDEKDLKIFIRNILGLKEEEINDAFSQFGTVKEIITRGNNNRCKGFGFVVFDGIPREAIKIIRTNLKIRDQMIWVDSARSVEEMKRNRDYYTSNNNNNISNNNSNNRSNSNPSNNFPNCPFSPNRKQQQHQDRMARTCDPTTNVPSNSWNNNNRNESEFTSPQHPQQFQNNPAEAYVYYKKQLQNCVEEIDTLQLKHRYLSKLMHNSAKQVGIRPVVVQRNQQTSAEPHQYLDVPSSRAAYNGTSLSRYPSAEYQRYSTSQQDYYESGQSGRDQSYNSLFSVSPKEYCSPRGVRSHPKVQQPGPNESTDRRFT